MESECNIEAMSNVYRRFSERTDLLLKALSMKGRVVTNGARKKVNTRQGGLWLTPIWQSHFDVFFVEVIPGTQYEHPDHMHPGDEYIIQFTGELDLEIEGSGLVTLRPGDVLKVPRAVVHRAKEYRGIVGAQPSSTVEELVILNPPDPAFRPE